MSLGIPVHTYVPGMMGMNVTDGFGFATGVAVKVVISKSSYQIDDHYTWVTGQHQFGLGVTSSFWAVTNSDYATSNGTFNFLGRQTGMGLADFVVGRLDRLDHGAPSTLDMTQRYLGVFGQDSWQTVAARDVERRAALGTVLRAEHDERRGVEFFARELPQRRPVAGVQRTPPSGCSFRVTPASTPRGINTRWWNLSPRAGVAWDVAGDGRTAVRSSYAMNYDLPTGQFMYRLATGAPFSSRTAVENTLLEDPYRGFPGGQIHPIPQPPTADAPFSAYSPFVTIDPNINSTRVQSWNVTVERQLGARTSSRRAIWATISTAYGVSSR